MVVHKKKNLFRACRIHKQGRVFLLHWVSSVHSLFQISGKAGCRNVFGNNHAFVIQ